MTINGAKLVELARQSIKSNFCEAEFPNCAEMAGIRDYGVFVSLHRGDELRGCIGHLTPLEENLVEEVKSCAILAAFRDPRFPPLESQELEDLDVEVHLLFPPEKITSVDQLDPQIYGVIVESGGRRGTLLPGLEGVKTVEMQVKIALQKAGISPDENYQVFRYKGMKFS